MNDSADQPEKVPATTDLSGRQLGDFRLLRRLGRGAMAEVYLAEQGRLKRRVALKILKPDLAEDRTYLQRFEREAQAAASLIHANIVQIYEVGSVDRFHYIAQEYVEGQNLSQLIVREGPPRLPNALSIIRQVASALAKAAEQDVVHRDIKPANILLTHGGEVKVADFGLARVARKGEKTDLTQVGVTLGTPLYMSPEQVEGKPLDTRSDLYSFGVTCYQMLSGSPPFSGETALGVAVQHLQKRPAPLENVRPDLPAALCRMVHKMLEKDPERRYGSARDMLPELRRLCQELPDAERPEDLPDWETTSMELPVDRRGELTQELTVLMQAAASHRPGKGRQLLFAVGLFASFLLGGLIAWFTTAEPWLLAAAASSPSSVPKRDTAMQQYLYASRIGTEDAWESVIEHFGDKEFFVRRAQQQLARIYLHDSQWDRAMEIFEEFAGLGPAEDELRAFGLAGKCGVLSLQGKYAESAAVMEQFWPLRRRLTDRQMQTLLSYALKRNRSKLGAEVTSRQWDQWLAEQFTENE